jgi:hypothetical protein
MDAAVGLLAASAIWARDSVMPSLHPRTVHDSTLRRPGDTKPAKTGIDHGQDVPISMEAR